MQLRVHLASGDDRTVVPLSLGVPERATRGGYLEVLGGLSSWDSGIYDARTPGDLAAAVAAMTKNDQVLASMRFFKRGKDIVREGTSEPQDLAVRGRKFAEVRVRR